MASIGHIAVGMLVGRACEARSKKERVLTVAAFGGLGLLPDIDVLALPFGIDHDSTYGHRGYSHSLLFVVAVTTAVFFIARKWGTKPLFTSLLAFMAVASHGLMDAMTYRTRGIMFFWPLSDERFTLPWRFIPPAPTGIEYVSHRGSEVAAVELVYFLPLALVAIAPPLAVWKRWGVGLANWARNLFAGPHAAFIPAPVQAAPAPLNARRAVGRVAAMLLVICLNMALADAYLSQSRVVAWIEQSTQQNLAVSLMRRPQFRHLR